MIPPVELTYIWMYLRICVHMSYNQSISILNVKSCNISFWKGWVTKHWLRLILEYYFTCKSNLHLEKNCVVRDRMERSLPLEKSFTSPSVKLCLISWRSQHRKKSAMVNKTEFYICLFLLHFVRRLLLCFTGICKNF